MAAVDKEYVKRTIYELSKDSHHYKNEQRKQQQLEERINRLNSIAENLTFYELEELTKEADKKIDEFANERDLTQTWFCVDMDAFFAAVEELDDPSLRGRPMAVGSLSMISTANYEARKYGVRSAMPGFIALKLCPELTLVEHHFDKYKSASNSAREVFRQFDPEFESSSLDEAYLNVTTYCYDHNAMSYDVAAQLRNQVHEATRLTCSIGIAPNCSLAKISSNINKPNGQFQIESSESAILSFLATLPVRKVPGIGGVMEQTLKAFGVKCVSDIIKRRGLLSALFSDSTFEFLLQSGLGLGRVAHHERTPEGEICRKGLSCEKTFRKTNSKSELLEVLREISDDVSRHLCVENLRGKTITLKLKSHTFELRTRATTLPFYVSGARELYTHATSLLDLEMEFGPFRLMGIRVSNFQHQDGERQSMITDFLNTTTATDPPRCCVHWTEEVTGRFVCNDCGMVCCGERCLQEHTDLHIAETLQQQESQLPSLIVRRQKPKRSNKRRGGQLTLNECLIERQTRSK
eukprot:g3187.t1